MTRRALLAAVLAAASAGCGAPRTSGPPELRAGADACDGCGMLIADTRVAAAADAREEGVERTLRFDDIGCLVRWQAAHPSSEAVRLWVRDRAGDRWVDAPSAALVRCDPSTTPMGSGLLAFASPGDAAEFLRSHPGEPVAWSDLRAGFPASAPASPDGRASSEGRR